MKIYKKLVILMAMLLGSALLVSCGRDDTYELAKKINHYKLYGEGYEETLAMAQKGHYNANCRDCFVGIDTSNISLFAFACGVDYEIAKAIYANGADIEISNASYYETPLLAALYGNRNNTEIIYWLLDEGADINAVSFDKHCVFNYLTYWDDNEDTQELIKYFRENCDLEYLEKSIEGTVFSDWGELWDENGGLVFYGAEH